MFHITELEFNILTPCVVVVVVQCIFEESESRHDVVDTYLIIILSYYNCWGPNHTLLFINYS